MAGTDLADSRQFVQALMRIDDATATQRHEPLAESRRSDMGGSDSSWTYYRPMQMQKRNFENKREFEKKRDCEDKRDSDCRCDYDGRRVYGNRRDYDNKRENLNRQGDQAPPQ